MKIPKKEPVVAAAAAAVTGLDIQASTPTKTKSHKHKHKKRKHAEAFGSEESKKKAIDSAGAASSSVVSQTLPPLENFPVGGGVDLSSPFPSKAIDSSAEKKKHKKAKHKEHKEHKHKKHKHHKKSDPDPV